jgi:hypothetical protein
MTKEHRKKLFDSAIDENTKMLYSEDALPFIYIFDSMNDKFIEWFEMEVLKENSWDQQYTHYPKKMNYQQWMEHLWEHRVEWLTEFCSLVSKPFDKPHITECRVETRQQYKEFTYADILLLIECIGKASSMLYCASRDIFMCCHVLRPKQYQPMTQYYEGALEYVVNLTATFTQSNPGNFIDLHTKLSKYKHK